MELTQQIRDGTIPPDVYAMFRLFRRWAIIGGETIRRGLSHWAKTI
ncbi:MAG TPA: hypothetical protein VKB46_26655 [Pyrinomonadaceae bacterium]|nr:hypothetical protein [Pyrinomonadaceae bacterium]